MFTTNHLYKNHVRTATLLVLMVASIALTHCGSGEPPPTAPPAPAPGELSLSARPNPVQAVRSTDLTFDWMASFTLLAREIGGVPGEIVGLNADLEESTGAIAVATGDNDFTFRVNAPEGSRVPAFGSQRVDFTFFFTIERGSPESIITIEALYDDDNDFESEASIRIPVVR